MENEHPAALWNWPLRWSIGAATPIAAFGAWYAALADRRAATAANASKVLQACDWGPSCNPKCPLFT